MFEFLRSHAVALPTLAKFAIAMAVIVWVPRLSRQARLPAVVGLLLSGIAIGPHGLDVIGPHRPIADFFADLGKLLLMFCAGLEIDLGLFRRARSRVIAFGVLTTLLPLLLGTGAGFLFGFPPGCGYGDCAGGVAETFVPLAVSLPVSVLASGGMHYLRRQIEGLDLDMHAGILNLLDHLGRRPAGC